VRPLSAHGTVSTMVARTLRRVGISSPVHGAHVEDTYWYLEATPELLCDIATARDAFIQGGAQ
jgi:hypothetical protein